MGWLDGWPFKNQEQQIKEQKEFERRVFPFGDAQKEKALAVLREVVPNRKIQDSELLFAFISVKDKYVQEEMTQAAFETGRASLQRMRWLKKEDVEPVLALVQLDTDIDSLDDYPTAQAVLDAVAGV